MNALAVIEADAAAANTARRNDPYTSPATIKACAKESAAARAAIAELIEANHAALKLLESVCPHHPQTADLRATIARAEGAK